MRTHMLALILASLPLLATLGEPAIRGPAQDPRTPILLPPDARDAVLAEMREMLRAVHGVLQGLADGDRRAMRHAAESAGTAHAVDTDPAVRARLPGAFLELGVGTHAAFDTLASAIAEGAGPSEVTMQLADLTAKCVACHAAYRIRTP